MAIGAIILDPQNDLEKNFFLPVATEAFFKECWMPAIEALGLQWVDLFSTGVDVEEEDLPSILEELRKIEEWADQHLEEETKVNVSERIRGLREKLPLAFHRKDAVVFIG